MNTYPETLEPRRLLSATLTAGVLSVEGTAAADDIRVYFYRSEPGADAKYVVEVGPRFTKPPTRFWEFPAEDVRSVAVRAGAGDDVVDLAAATIPIPLGAFADIGPVRVPTRVDAGLGGDVVYGGASRDMIFGGFGDDDVFGGAGDDWLDGGWGNDDLSGGNGNDYVSGSLGNDNVYGDVGNDRLTGGPGNDHVGRNGVGPMASEPGNDLLIGGTGEDWMVGGEGKDLIFGGPGRDHFSLEDAESEKLDRTPDEPNDVPIFD